MFNFRKLFHSSEPSGLGLNNDSQQEKQQQALERERKNGLDNMEIVEGKADATGKPSIEVVSSEEARRREVKAHAAEQVRIQEEQQQQADQAASKAEKSAPAVQSEAQPVETPAEREAHGEQAAATVVEEAAAGLPEGAREALKDPEVKRSVVAEVMNLPVFGKSFKERAVDFLGSRTATFLTGAGLGGLARTSINSIAPGWGVAAGAAAGGVAGTWRAYRQESRRAEEVQTYLESMKGKEPVDLVQRYVQASSELEGKATPERKTALRQELESLSVMIKQAEWKEAKGVDRVRQLIALRENAGAESFKNDKKSKEILATLGRDYSTQKDKRKIIAGGIRGAVFGGAGAYAGGLIVSWFEHAGDHVAGIINSKHAEDIRSYFAGLKNPDAGKIGDTALMHENVWNTVKDFFHAHGVPNPDNATINDATREIARINGITIASDHAPGETILGLIDTKMPEGFQLHGFEQLRSFLPAGDLAAHSVPVDSPGAGVAFTMEQHIGAEDLEKILGVMGIVGAGEVAARVLERSGRPANETPPEAAPVPQAEQGPFEKEWQEKAALAAAEIIRNIEARGREIAGAPDFASQYGILSEQSMAAWNAFRRSVPEAPAGQPGMPLFISERTGEIVQALDAVLKNHEKGFIEPDFTPEAGELSREQWEEKISATTKRLADELLAKTEASCRAGDFSAVNAKLIPETVQAWNEFRQNIPGGMRLMVGISLHEGSAQLVYAYDKAEKMAAEMRNADAPDEPKKTVEIPAEAGPSPEAEAKKALDAEYAAAMGFLDAVEKELRQGMELDFNSAYKKVWGAYAKGPEDYPAGLKTVYTQYRHEIGSRFELLVALAGELAEDRKAEQDKKEQEARGWKKLMEEARAGFGQRLEEIQAAFENPGLTAEEKLSIFDQKQPEIEQLAETIPDVSPSGVDKAMIDEMRPQFLALVSRHDALIKQAQELREGLRVPAVPAPAPKAVKKAVKAEPPLAEPLPARVESPEEAAEIRATAEALEVEEGAWREVLKKLRVLELDRKTENKFIKKIESFLSAPESQSATMEELLREGYNMREAGDESNWRKFFLAIREVNPQLIQRIVVLENKIRKEYALDPLDGKKRGGKRP